jgi:hypothetical protein
MLEVASPGRQLYGEQLRGYGGYGSLLRTVPRSKSISLGRYPRK